MRRAITFLLLAATAASPLAAQAWIGQGQGPERADRDDRGRIQDHGRDRPPAAPDRGDWRGSPDRGPDRPDGWRGDPRDDRRGGRDGPRAGGWLGGPDGPRGDARRDDPRRPGGSRSGDARDWRDGGRDPSRDAWGRPGGGRPDYRWSDNRRGGWDSRWREDRRFDWQGYRAGNRAIYRAPRYYDPRGSAYSRWTPGYRVLPAFYGRDYWLADPWRYRLPPAYGSYRWVRYYDDVALVDVRSGLIEDILYGVFWR